LVPALEQKLAQQTQLMQERPAGPSLLFLSDKDLVQLELNMSAFHAAVVLLALKLVRGPEPVSEQVLHT